jgi:cytochrome c biogenesis protein CcdA
VALFTLVGLALALGGRALGVAFPIAAIGLGVLAIGTGVWLAATGQTFGLTRLDRVGVPAGQAARTIFGFGVAYGVLSLACTLPIFLVVVTTSLTGSLWEALLQFVAYSLGMGTVITAVAISAALAGGVLGRALARARRWMPRVAGVFLALAGIYVLYYWIVFGRLFA